VLEHVIEGEKGGTEGQGKILKQLLDGLMENNGYCKLKEAALGWPLWRNRFRRGCGSIVRQTTS
jgi:hypothetical protein